jgi:hypothetical protein
MPREALEDERASADRVSAPPVGGPDSRTDWYPDYDESE